MLRSSPSSASSPACALSPPETPPEGSPRKNEGFGKAYQHYLADQGPARSPYQGQRPRKQNDQPEYVSNDWRSGSYDSSNTSWESDWSASRGGTIKSESPGTTAFYKYRNTTGSYQSGTDWSGDPPAYGVMQQSQQSSSNSPSASSSSYYDSNDYYGYGYDQNARGGPPSGYQQYGTMPPQQYQGGSMSGPYNGNRNPSTCPPNPNKQQEYQRRQTRYGMDGVFRTQIKREPDAEGGEAEGENFTSLFTKSLTSLYSQDTENTYGEDSKTYDSDIMICTPGSSVSPMEDNTYQRLGPPPQSQYNPGYPNQMRNNFGFYENRQPNCEQNVVQELGSGPDRSNSFRYDRPSFDDMHLYASSPPDPKGQAKKRKLSMPNMGPDGKNYPSGEAAHPRRKATRGMTFKSDAQWTPNSFAFSDVHIKQEPVEDYTSEDLESQNRNMAQYKDSSLGNGTGSKSPGSQPEHNKAPPRKRSPGSTCFDRFEKKSTPQSKKVSPLSVYAKVQECIVLNVKCRRYKKRTKPANAKEEVVYPGKEEIENWKRTGAYSESPDQAVRHLMGDMLEKVSHYGARAVDTSGPDLSQIDVMKVRELLYQFCQRYTLDYRDFEDIDTVLRPNIIKDKTAKNSLRASAIRKRTSVSPARPKQAPDPETKPPRTERAVKKSNSDAPKQAERRVLRSLPGRSAPARADRSRQPRRRIGKTPVLRRRYSTRSVKDVEESSNNSDVDIVIDSSTDRESEAGKEAEVRKTSQRLKNKQSPPPVETPAKENTKPTTKVLRNAVVKLEEQPHTRTRSREKKEIEKLRDSVKASPKKKWSRLHVTSNENSMSSSGDSVEIISTTGSSTRNTGKESKIAIKIESLPNAKTTTAVKSSERIANRNSKMNDEHSRKTSKPSDDSSSRVSKQDESQSKSSKRLEEVAAKNTKAKELSKKNSKGEETSSSKTPRRSEKVTTQVKNRKNHFVGRRGKSTDAEKDPITIEEDSCHSKSDDDSSSKASEKESKTSLIESDESSDESKDTVSEQEKNILDGKKSHSNFSEISSVAKDSKVNKDESENTIDVSEDSDNNESLASNDSTKPDDVEKTTELACDREQTTEKPFKFSILNDRNESTLQVKLNRLPLKLDSKKRILPIESQDFFRSISKPKIETESPPDTALEEKVHTDLDLQSPPKLVCMKEPTKETEELNPKEEPSTNPSTNEADDTESPTNLVASETEPAPKATEPNKPPNDGEVLGKPLPIIRPRYSESEDSDCGLVIDLDRRLSIEERVPSPTFQTAPEKKSEPKDLSVTLNLVKKEPSVTPPADETTSQASNSSLNHMEDDCILLPPSEDPLRLDSRSTSFLETTAKSLSESDIERVKRLKDQDESILRTLLLETPDVSSGASQELLPQNHGETPSDIPADSKASISQDVMKLLMYQTYNEVSPLCNSPGFDEKKISIDQLTSDASDEECSRDPRFLKEQMKKLRNEIVYLQCMIDQKDKERTAIICFKRYKEEVLKRVVKQYAASVQFRDWIRARQESSSSERSSTERNSSDRASSGKPVSTSAPVPISTSLSTSSSHASESSHTHVSSPHSQVIQLAYHATVKTDVPTTSTTTSVSKKSPTQSSESLPTVATMIAKATENYGVDMRTMRNGTNSTQTILQKVLSSKESIYSPTACRSPSSDKSISSKPTIHHQQQSVQIIQKTLPSPRESCYSPAHRMSPSLPELRPGPPKSSTPSHPQLLQKALSSKDSSPASSLSPPSLQPELRTTKSLASSPSSVQNKPLDLIVTTAEKLKMSASKSYDSINTGVSKSSPDRNSKHNSSPKRSSSTSYSAWSTVHSRTSLSATASATINLRTDHSRTNQEPLSLSKRPHSRSNSHSSNGQGFMVVPPPVTLQQSQKTSIVHQSRPESSHPHEKSVKNSVERIYSRKTDEERRTMSYPSSMLSSSNSLPYPHKIVQHSATSNGNSIGNIKTISQPLTAPTNSNTPRCMGCGLSHAKFLCSGCRSHWYCSHECQSMRWPEHSQTCVGNIGVYNQSSGSSYS